MPEDVVKKLTVTFGTDLPHGTHGSFKHDGELWIAYPAKKAQRILAGIDRMIGEYNLVIEEMVRWIVAWPDDTERVNRVMKLIQRGRTVSQELTIEKTRARTE